VSRPVYSYSFCTTHVGIPGETILSVLVEPYCYVIKSAIVTPTIDLDDTSSISVGIAGITWVNQHFGGDITLAIGQTFFENETILGHGIVWDTELLGVAEIISEIGGTGEWDFLISGYRLTPT